jgi:predicted membrane-bound spermidine synthase
LRYSEFIAAEIEKVVWQIAAFGDIKSRLTALGGGDGLAMRNVGQHGEKTYFRIVPLNVETDEVGG